MSISRLMQTASGKRGFDPNTPIGTAIEGGFFAGIITEGGDDYAIIVAPKASGENTSVQYKTANTASPAATRTLNNGPAATAAMVAAGSHPAAAFCDGLTIGGFSDWYLPARDELELLFRNFKPITLQNNTANRAKATVTYPEGNDLSSDTNGRNRNSNPIGAGYTPGVPARTSVTAFVEGGTQAFVLTTYSSSSEFSDGGVPGYWRQDFNNSAQTKDSKTFARHVRAVRRVAV